MGSIGDVISMKYDDDAKMVRIYYSLNEDIASIDVIKGNKDMMLDLTKLLFGQNDNKKLYHFHHG